MSIKITRVTTASEAQRGFGIIGKIYVTTFDDSTNMPDAYFVLTLRSGQNGIFIQRKYGMRKVGDKTYSDVVLTDSFVAKIMMELRELSKINPNASQILNALSGSPISSSKPTPNSKVDNNNDII